jgi:hypothetical protein
MRNKAGRRNIKKIMIAVKQCRIRDTYILGSPMKTVVIPLIRNSTRCSKQENAKKKTQIDINDHKPILFF